MKSLKTGISTFALIGGLFFFPLLSSAFQVQNLGDIPVSNDFTVGPAKLESFVEPGEERVLSLSIANRTGRSHRFSISIEDFTSSSEEGRSVELLGESVGERSLKSFVYIADKDFTLSHGQRALVPVVVSIPAGTDPGGRYAGVVVSMFPTDSDLPVGGVSAQTQTIAQIASLLFITVSGENVYEGKLESFQTKNNQLFFANSQIPFRLVFSNEGTAHLNPYGIIVIKNMFGKEVGVIEVDPWFVLPESMRTRDLSLDGKNFFGKYTAVAQINRGYGDVVDEMQTSFFVLPIQKILILIGLLFGVVFLTKKSLAKKKEL